MNTIAMIAVVRGQLILVDKDNDMTMGMWYAALVIVCAILSEEYLYE